MTDAVVGIVLVNPITTAYAVKVYVSNNPSMNITPINTPTIISLLMTHVPTRTSNYITTTIIHKLYDTPRTPGAVLGTLFMVLFETPPNTN